MLETLIAAQRKLEMHALYRRGMHLATVSNLVAEVSTEFAEAIAFEAIALERRDVALAIAEGLKACERSAANVLRALESAESTDQS